VNERRLLTEDEVRSELFHSETLLAAARAEEKRQLLYMLLGGSPVALVAVFWQFWGNAGWAIVVAVILFTLWHTVRWTIVSRRASELETRHEELTEIQARLTARDESALGPGP
jgi:Flp pilus assembly protein TadB